MKLLLCFLCLFIIHLSLSGDSKYYVTASTATPWSAPPYDLRFVDNPVMSALDRPVGALYAPGGALYSWQKGGEVWVKPPGKTQTLLINITAEVSDVGDRGLLGFALDPKFTSNGYFYLYYTVRPAKDDWSLTTWTWSRVTRYTASASSNRTKAVGTSRKVLLGQNAKNGIPVCSISHSAGTIMFGHDGKLYLSHGDAAAYDKGDWGYNDACRALFGENQDIGSFRSQSLSSMSGKILRIDPATGLGLKDNPFYVAGQSLDTPRARIWALGLRNPFRMDLKPKVGNSTETVFFVCDNGWATWEEINIVRKGTNAGWPCSEGPQRLNDFIQNEKYCKLENMVGNRRDPEMYWHHWDPTLSKPQGLVGASTTGIAFYRGKNYPSDYVFGDKTGDYMSFFFCDYANNWMKVAFMDSKEHIVGISDFANVAYPVFIGSTSGVQKGEIYYVSYFTDAVQIINYKENSPPIVFISSNTTSPGKGKGAVQFYSDGSYSPTGQELKFKWDFGDGTKSNAPNPKHTYTKRGNFTVTLSLTTASEGTATSKMKISTWNAPPTVKITSPAAANAPHRYTVGDSVTLAATHSAGTKLFWDLQLIHNGHIHPETESSVAERPTFTLTEDQTPAFERYCYRVVVTATDSMGNQAKDQAYFFGTKTNLAWDNTPYASFALTPAAPKVNHAFLLDASGSLDPDNDYLEYDWVFNDGIGLRETKNLATTRHVYTTPGVYNVTVKVRDSIGRFMTKRKQVEVFPTSLVGVWRFDENVGTTSTDSSNNGQNAHLHGASWVVMDSAVSPACIEFDPAKRSYVSIEANNNQSPMNLIEGDMTIRLNMASWFGEGDGDTWVKILSKKRLANDTTGFELLYNPAKSSLGFKGSSAAVVNSTVAAVPRWGWNAISVVVSPTGKVTFRVNNVNVTPANAPSAGVIKRNQAPIILGKAPWGQWGYFKGMMDDIVLLNPGN